VRIVTTVSLVINGQAVQADVAPRTSLADFLREHQALTATHVGCEHGVCGACTVLIDGAPARSCITLAAAADQAEVTTLEGFEADPVINILREAFSEHHGLQCGFCTPGMLMTARDIVTRLPDADEKRIRLELSGNLCRCTGYVGIVNAVQSAQAKAKTLHLATALPTRSIGPVGAHPPTKQRKASRAPIAVAPPKVQTPALGAVENFDAMEWALVERDGAELRQSFSVPFARAAVWRFFADLDQVARCMPGARLTRPEQGGRAEGEVNVKLGPILSAFHGALHVQRDDNDFRGVVRGAGRDARSPSSARAIISYDVRSLEISASQVDVSVKFLLSGALAQFSRSGLVRDIAENLTKTFARNLAARLSGAPADVPSASVLDAGTAARTALWTRFDNFLRRVMG
jgi:carbon-monoxide dehydrogenase small subunit